MREINSGQNRLGESEVIATPLIPPLANLGDHIGSFIWWRQMFVCTSGLLMILFGGILLAPTVEPSSALEAATSEMTNRQVSSALPIGPDEEISQTDVTPKEPITAQISDSVKVPTLIPEPIKLKLKRGQSMVQSLRNAGINSQNAHKAANALADHIDMRRLQAGQNYSLTFDGKVPGTIASLTIRDQFLRQVNLKATEVGFVTSTSVIATVGLTRFAEAKITDSLFLSAERAGIPPAIIVELIKLYSFDVDFQREIWPGDSFSVYFDRTIAPEFGDVLEGHILYAQLKLRKRTIELTRFEAEDGTVDYFDASGKSVRKALMKTPIDGARLSSHFGSRKHPVLGYKLKHRGVDFSAPTGTPIMAAGDGVVERASRYGAYGNYIRIRHNGAYKTAYAHMSKYGRGIKKGKRVRQGQIIGYVGATGRVTGRHLHYEVYQNGNRINPLTMKLPTGKQLKGDSLLAFEHMYNLLLADMGMAQQFERARLLALKHHGASAAGISSGE